MDVYKGRTLPASWSLDVLHDWMNKFSNMRLFNRQSLSTLALAGQLVLGVEVEKREFDVLQYVDPLIGTAKGGRVKYIIFGTPR
jgi:hypothetical protein